MGRLEILLGVLVVAGLGYLALGFTHGKTVDMCTPLPLSQEVKAYIDSKVAQTSEGACGEIPSLIGKLADLETKMGQLDAYRVAVTQRETKKAENAESLESVHNHTIAVLKQERENEIDRLKREVGSLCGGVKRGGGSVGIQGLDETPKTTTAAPGATGTDAK